MMGSSPVSLATVLLRRARDVPRWPRAIRSDTFEHLVTGIAAFFLPVVIATMLASNNTTAEAARSDSATPVVTDHARSAARLVRCQPEAPFDGAKSGTIPDFAPSKLRCAA